jgi:TolB-like protein/DNA-binding winged helix-turn-helix (wHTH) protein/Tfp pilus assembly protein PilF
MEPPVRQRYSFGPFLLDPTEKVLLRKGEPLALPPKALETLLALVQRRGHIIEKTDLLERVWPNTFVEEATLTQNIFTLRKALGDSPNGHEYIETIPRRGYRFVGLVKAVNHPPASEDQKSQRTATPTRGVLLWTGLALVVTLTTVSVYFRARSRGLEPRSAGTKTTLAVLPFQNLTPDPEQEYFSDGLTEEMITQLGGLNPDRLGVIARTSAMHYKGTTETAAQIGRELGVDYLVEGSFRREGSRVRVSAQLIRVRDQMHLWAQDYDRDFSDYLALENDVSRDIANQIQLKLSAQPLARASHLLNPNAYDAYLKGRFFWNKRTEEGHLKAIEYFNQAIAIDPGYAQAYSGLADAYALLGSNPTTAITRRDAMEKARASARKALAIDDSLAEAHTSLAFVYWHYDWNWPAAEKEFQRALQLNPSYATTHHWYAFYLVSRGRMDQALEEMRRAQQTDPLSLIINTDAAQILYFSGHHDEAVEEAKRVLEMDPQFPLARLPLVWSYLEKHQYDAAIEEAKKEMQVSGAGPDLQAILAATYAAAGQQQQARELLRRLKTESTRQRRGQFFFVPIAEVYAVLGDRDEAFAWLERDFQNRNGGLVLLKVHPYLNSLHGDPRFADLVRRVGLPP